MANVNGSSGDARWISGQADPAMAEFQRANLYWTVGIIGGLALAGQLFLFAVHPENLFNLDGLNLILAFAMIVIPLWLSSRNALIAWLIWGLGIALLCANMAISFQTPEIILACSILPFLGAVLVSWGGGLLAASFAVGISFLFAALYPGLPELRSAVLQVVLASLLTGTLGGIFRYTLVDAIRTYYQNYRAVSRDLQEARAERVEFKQVQEDLFHANRELARLTQQLKILNHAAEEARRAKETFVATVSHELRTPLNMIIGFSEVIALSSKVYGIQLPPVLLADIGSIHRNSQHLLELVNDVLDLSQVDMGNLSVARDWCSLNQIFGEALEVIRPLFQSKSLILKSFLPDGDNRVYCDQTRIREVIINLLSNAGRFTEKGGISLGAVLDNERLVVSVADTGPGISVENQKRLFEPFQQLDSSIRRKHGGSGLGLAISKRFVEMHGGQMWLESQVGKGTTISFSLPIAPVVVEPVGAARWVNPIAAVEGRDRPFKIKLGIAPPRIVIFEEGEVIRRLVDRYLGEAEISNVRSLDEAIQVLSLAPAQIFIINHPQAQELIEQENLKNRLPFGLTVMAFWLPGGKDFANSLGAKRYLVKPVSQEALLAALAELENIHDVLLVDDNPEILQLYGRFLGGQSNNYRILRANGGQQALDLLRKRKPDVMILDLIMPEMDGFQVLKARQADPLLRDIPVIVITAQDPSGLPHASDVVSFTREGGFSPRNLLDLVRTVGLHIETKPI